MMYKYPALRGAPLARNMTILPLVGLLCCTLEPLRGEPEPSPKDAREAMEEEAGQDLWYDEAPSDNKTSEQAIELAAGDEGAWEIAEAGESGELVKEVTADPSTGDEALEADTLPAYVCWPECKGQMLKVPAGPFTMGCDDEICEAAEKPAHVVEVPAFEIDASEVTVGDWAKCSDCPLPVIPDEPGCNATKAEDLPVNCVSWQEAKHYCEAVGKRLCTEAEWEKAARGTDGRHYPWGNGDPSCSLAVFDEAGGAAGCGSGGAMPVGSLPAGSSPCGAVDMAGNVREWVEDRYHADYTGAPSDGSAWVAGDEEKRVVRGGGFRSKTWAELRATNRRAGLADQRWVDVGVRCCK